MWTCCRGGGPSVYHQLWESQCSAGRPGALLLRRVLGLWSSWSIFGCELRTAWWSVCLRHVLRSCVLDDVPAWKIFTAYTGARASCSHDQPWLNTWSFYFWSSVELGWPPCLCIQRSAMPVKLWGWITVFPSSEVHGQGLPWWSGGQVSELPMQVGLGSIPGQGTISHMPQLKDPTCRS